MLSLLSCCPVVAQQHVALATWYGRYQVPVLASRQKRCKVPLVEWGLRDSRRGLLFAGLLAVCGIHIVGVVVCGSASTSTAVGVLNTGSSSYQQS